MVATHAIRTTDHGLVVGTASKLILVQHEDLKSVHVQIADAEVPIKIGGIKDGVQTPSVLPEADGSLLKELLKDRWQPSSYHEGIRRATITPLSIRLALITAQRVATTQQTVVLKGNEVSHDLDPRVKARAPSRLTVSTPGTCSTHNALHGDINNAEQGRRKENRCGYCRKELLEAHEEIRAKDRRIRELQLALHETERWTDAMTYQGGQKRRRA